MSKYNKGKPEPVAIAFGTDVSSDTVLVLTEDPCSVLLSLHSFKELLLPSCLESEFTKLTDDIWDMRKNEEDTILFAWIHSIVCHCLLDPDILDTLLPRIKPIKIVGQQPTCGDHIFADLSVMKEFLISALSHTTCGLNSCEVIASMSAFREWIKKCRRSTVSRSETQGITAEMKDKWTDLLDNLFVPDTPRV